MSRIGTITIGQSPRTDIVPEFRAALGRSVEITERGGLDGLSLAEVRELAPRQGDYVLVTRMRDGTEVTISHRTVVERVKACVADLEESGVDLIVLFCTGEFPELTSRKLIVKPDALLENVVRALLPAGRLAAVVPSPEQVPILEKRWTRVSTDLVVDSVSPYSSSEADLEATARRIAAGAPDLVVLDCMGFGESVRSLFRRVTGKPVLLPRTLLGRVAGELAG
jgi:protein AroM